MNLRVDIEIASGVTRLLLVATFMPSSESDGECEDIFAVQDVDEWPLSSSQ